MERGHAARGNRAEGYGTLLISVMPPAGTRAGRGAAGGASWMGWCMAAAASRATKLNRDLCTPRIQLHGAPTRARQRPERLTRRAKLLLVEQRTGRGETMSRSSAKRPQGVGGSGIVGMKRSFPLRAASSLGSPDGSWL